METLHDDNDAPRHLVVEAAQQGVVEPGVGSAPLKPSDEFVTALKILASRRGFRYGLFFPVWADVAEFIPCKRELIPCSDS